MFGQNTAGRWGAGHIEDFLSLVSPEGITERGHDKCAAAADCILHGADNSFANPLAFETAFRHAEIGDVRMHDDHVAAYEFRGLSSLR